MADGFGAASWLSVPGEKTRVWARLFDASTEGIDLRAKCPVCAHAALHRWFYLHRTEISTSSGRQWIGRGGQWQWCSNCHSYEHSSGLVPDWWEWPFSIDLDDLRHDPGPIEQERLRPRSSAGQVDAVALGYYEDLRGRATALLIVVERRLPVGQAAVMAELIDHNEPGVAVEMMIAILAEAEAVISSGEAMQIELLTRDMGLDESVSRQARTMVRDA